jgi:hypothetical protein
MGIFVNGEKTVFYFTTTKVDRKLLAKIIMGP